MILMALGYFVAAEDGAPRRLRAKNAFGPVECLIDSACSRRLWGTQDGLLPGCPEETRIQLWGLFCCCKRPPPRHSETCRAGRS